MQPYRLRSDFGLCHVSQELSRDGVAVLSFRARRAGSGQRAQSTIEFALTAPIFFLIFFGIINGGVLLFSRNAIQHSADVGAAQLASLGNSTLPPADSTALAAMQSAGLSKALLTNVTSVTIQEEDPSTGPSGETLTLDTSGCGISSSSTLSGGTGYPCEMLYTDVAGTWTCNPATVTCNWPAAARLTDQTTGLTGDPDFARLTVAYTFSTIGGFATLDMSAAVVFRLEPQSL
jgi:Flp pilus assembly protein TadG